MSTRWTGRCCRCDQMMKLVREGSATTPIPMLRGNIILMHDSGGDRTPDRQAAAGADRSAARQGLQLRAGVGSWAASSRDEVMPRLPLTVIALCRPGGVPDPLLSRPVPLLLFPRRHHAGRGAAAGAGGLALWNRCAEGRGTPPHRPERPQPCDGADPRLQRGEGDRHHRRAHPGQRLSRIWKCW